MGFVATHISFLASKQLRVLPSGVGAFKQFIFAANKAKTDFS